MLPGFSSVPGQQVPGQLDPAFLTGLPLPGPVYHDYYGHYVLYYQDYVDQVTTKILIAVPGGSYSMAAVSNRAGLTDPPPDNRWDTPGMSYFLRRPGENALAAARLLNAAMQAVNARQPYWQASGGTPQAAERKPEPPSGAALMLARARALNAELQARPARGEKAGAG